MRIAALGLIALAGGAGAQVAPCPAPAPFGGWTQPVSQVAGEMRDGGKLPLLAPGRATVLTLAPSDAVKPELPARRTGTPAQYGGMVTFTVAVPGLYRVALGAPAWLEVGTPGHAIASVAHGHGEPCSPLRKLVDYRLAAGSYTLQLGAATAPVLTVAVARIG